MELIFLGNGACFYPVLHNTSAYFVYNNNLILLDCGETVYERLMGREDIGRFDQIYVILTHLHADHVGSLGSLLSYCTCILKKRIFVIYPDQVVCDLLSLIGIAPEFYDHRAQLGELVRGLHVKPVEVQHADDMKCYGYEIICENEHLYYSGDASDIPKEILEKFLAGTVSRLYQDTSTHDSKQPSHLYVGRLERLVPMERRKQVYCMHLDCDCREDFLRKGFSIAE